MTEDNERLYKLLDVDRESATSERVRAKFNKMSLREQFHQAFYILSDPERKRLYDLGGERVVDYLLSKSWGPMASKLGALWSIRLYGLCLFVGAVVVTLWFVLLAIKLDEDSVVTLSWGGTFVPLLMCLGGYLVLHTLSLVSAIRTHFPREDTDGVLLDRLPSCMNVLSAGCYLAFAILVAFALDGNDTAESLRSGEWLRFFSLLIIADLLAILSSCTWRHPDKVRRALNPTFRSSPPKILVYGFSILVVIALVLAVLRWVLIGAKIDGQYTGSWYRVFAPIPVRLFFAVAETLLNGIYLRHLGARTRGEIFFSTMGSLFMNSLVVMSVYLLAATLEGARLVSMANILTPVYILCGYLLMSAVFTVLVVPAKYRRLALLDQRNRASNPTTIHHDPFAPSGVNARAPPQASYLMVGGVPVMMPDDATSEQPRSLALDDVLSQDEEEEMEEVEVDEEPEHYLDEGHGIEQHSPFEGPGADPRYMHRYHYQPTTNAGGYGMYDDSRASSFSYQRSEMSAFRQSTAAAHRRAGRVSGPPSEAPSYQRSEVVPAGTENWRNPEHPRSEAQGGRRPQQSPSEALQPRDSGRPKASASQSDRGSTASQRQRPASPPRNLFDSALSQR